MRHAKRILPLLALLLLPLSLLAQDKALPEHQLLLTIKPQHYFLGAQLGLDYQLSKKVAIGGEVTSHFWFDTPPNIALTPHVKWFFKGQVGRGWYLRAKTVAGYFFKEVVIDERYSYYAGGGVGIGAIAPFLANNRFYIFFDAALAVVAPFGKRGADPLDEREKLAHQPGMWYYSIASPGATIELALGFAYRF